MCGLIYTKFGEEWSSGHIPITDANLFLKCWISSPFQNDTGSKLTVVESRDQILHFLLPVKLREGGGDVSVLWSSGALHIIEPPVHIFDARPLSRLAERRSGKI